MEYLLSQRRCDGVFLWSVITPLFFSSFSRTPTFLTKSLCFFALAPIWAIRSEIVQPVLKGVFGTPVLQPAITTVAERSELGSQSSASALPSRSASGNQP